MKEQDLFCHLTVYQLRHYMVQYKWPLGKVVLGQFLPPGPIFDTAALVNNYLHYEDMYVGLKHNK